MDLLRLAGQASVDVQHSVLFPTLVTQSSMSSFITSIDCFGRALAVDNAYRHLTSAEQYLMDAQKMQDSAPHTDVADYALQAIDTAKDFLRPYAVSPDNASCRDPPVCVVNEAVKTKARGFESIEVLSAVVEFTNPVEKRTKAIKFLFI